jgi:hypothetical protein
MAVTQEFTMKAYKPMIFAALAGVLAIAPAMAQTRTPLGDNRAAVGQPSTDSQQSSVPATPPMAPGQDPGTVEKGAAGGSGAGSASGK